MARRDILPGGYVAVPWASLPKWAWRQRLSDKSEHRPFWYTDTDRLNHFEFTFRALPGDPLVPEEGELVTIFADSRAVFLKALSAYRRDFNRYYDERDCFNEKEQFSVPFNIRRERRGKEEK